MKKRANLKKLAAMGIAGGILITNGQAYAHQGDHQWNNYVADTMSADTSGKMMTETDLMSQLNAEGKATYQGLSKEGKDLAIKLASQTCKGQNECKGLKSCKTEKNACMGLGGCKGTGPGPFKDKNDAVKVAAKKMADKRAKMMNGQ